MADHFRKKTLSLLRECGAVLVRSGNHNVYRLPNGCTVVISSTPGRKGSQNELARVRRLLRRTR